MIRRFTSFGGDPAGTDCNRVLRLPEFLNCEYDPVYPVRLDILTPDALLSPR
jgi:hypothetical protein